MKRLSIASIVLTLFASACSATTGGASVSPVNTASNASHAPVTLNVWSFYEGREFNDYSGALAGFRAKYPWITIVHTKAKVDQDYVRAINAGQPPDVAISAGPDNVAKFCQSGAYQDMAPYLKAGGINISSVIPDAALRYTSYQGVQCTLPVLSDAYGLYYNTDMFTKKGITSPPKTLSELEADAKALTVFNPDGSIKIAGFDPLSTLFENPNFYLGNFSQSKWYDSAGKSAFASDPSWAALLQWQKKFIADVYGPDGYKKLTFFARQAGAPDSEWSTSHPFELGKIAMMFDGEWRTAFIKGDKSKVNYATAPFPVADNIASMYGLGQIGGDVMGIPKGAQHPAEAWLFISFLATDTEAEMTLAEKIGNVPTTFESLKDPVLNSDPHFKPFLDIFGNPHSGFKQLTTAGSFDQEQWSAFMAKWEAGKVANLQSGLADLASLIDKQSQLG